jgi:hypothetical protein
MSEELDPGTDELPGAVRDLLRDRVQSYEELDVLLLMSQAPENSWTTESVARSLAIDSATCAASLDRLAAAGAIERIAGDVWRPALSPELLRALHDTYHRHRHVVMNAMSTYAVQRLRTSALRAFASAFLLGKKRDG